MCNSIISQNRFLSIFKTTKEFLEDLGLIEGYTVERGLYISFTNYNGAYVRTELTNKKSLLDATPEDGYIQAETLRFGLSIHKRNLSRISYQTFEKTRVFALIDIDEAVELEQLINTVEHLEHKPVYIKRTIKGWHLIYASDDWIKDKSLLNSLSEIVYKEALPYLGEVVKEKRKIENKNPILAETRPTTEKLICIKYRNFYTQEEIYEILRKSIKTTLDKEEREYISLENITLKDLEAVYNTCGILQDLDKRWDSHSYSEWLLIAHFYTLKHLAGDETAFEEFLKKSSEYLNFKEEEAVKQFDYLVKWIQGKANNQEGFLFSCSYYQSVCGSDYCKNCKGYPFVFAKSEVKTLDGQEIIVFHNSLNWIKEYIKGKSYTRYYNLSDILNIPDRLDNKTFFLVFNSINEAKEKGLEIAGALYGKGAGEVKVVVFSKNEGNTLKEVLDKAENKEEKLKYLINQSVEVFEFARQEIKSKEILKKFLQVAIVDEDIIDDILDILKVKGYKKTEARKVFDELLKEKKEKKKEQLEAQIGNIFGKNYKLPTGFYLRDNELITEQKVITTFFVVDKVYKSIDGKVYGYHIKTIDSKDFTLSIEDFNRTNIFKAFNENGIPTGDYGSLLINYITSFVRLNEKIIPEEVISEFVGWFNGNFLIPQTTEGVKFEIKGYGSKGKREEEFKLLKEIIEDGNILGIGYLASIGALLIEPLEVKNFIIFLTGTSGSGKTTTSALGLSLYGDYQTLLKGMNFTSVGLEILLKKNKDILIVLDELNTAKDLTQAINVIYHFHQGVGRVRANTRLNLRDVVEYRGILMLTAENDLNQILEKSDSIVRGALRRVLSFEYTEKIEREWIEKVYETISNNYGNLIKEIIGYIKTNKEEIKNTYKAYVEELYEKYDFRDGLEIYLAVLLTSLEILQKLYNLNIANMIANIIRLAKAYTEEIKDELAITKEKLEEKITGFVYENLSNFILSDVQQVMPKTVWGKIDNEGLYITYTAFKHLSKYVKLGERSFKKLLTHYGLVECGNGRLIKDTSFTVNGLKVKGYKIIIQLKENIINKMNKHNIINNEEEIDF
ncbi:MAG: DUF927 domain-containing protein [Candidatus Aenigmatarchaeota archaeon]